MAKVKATLADVKTTFENAPPDRYRMKIVEIKEKTEPAEGDPTIERQNFNFKLAINDGGEHNGKPIYHNISLHTKKGEPNRAGLADLKRFFMAVLGLDEDDEFFQDDSNLDTDLLLNQEIEGDVVIEPWSKPAGPGQPEKKGESNRINSTSITAVGAGR